MELYKKTVSIILLLLILIGGIFIYIKSTTTSENVSAEKLLSNSYLFVYSHPTQGKTVVSSTNDGVEYIKGEYNVQDTPNIERGLNNELLILSEHNSNYYTIGDGKLQKHEVPGPLTFIEESKELAIKSYNIDISDNILEVNDTTYNKEYKLTLPTYLEDISYDDKKIYVINNTLDEKALLHVVDRISGTVINTVELNSYLVNILSYKDQLIIVGIDEITIVNKNTLKKKEIQYESNVFMPIEIINDNNIFYFIYADLNGHTNISKLNSKFEIEQDINLKFPYMVSEIKDMKLHILYQIENSQDIGGKFAVFDIRNGVKLIEFDIPVENVKVQNLLIN